MTLPLGGVEELLAEGRERTLRLVEPVSDPDLDRVHDPLMSPLVWDLGHIAAYEDVWVCHRTGGLDLLRPDLAELYDAFETPRAERGDTPYLGRGDALEYMAEVRERSLEVLAATGPDHHVWQLVAQHEHQHDETMLQTLQLADPGAYAPERPAVAGAAAGGSLSVPGGAVELGHAGPGFVYDNERPRHLVELAPFAIDRAPVTNAAYLEFVEDDGYQRQELWTEEGWEHRLRERWERPLYWSQDETIRRFDREVDLEPELPVMHVSWFEADAFARWRGARLPSEVEWERAAALAGAERGHLDQLEFGPGPAGPFVGDCWEWTAGEFRGYPGFAPFPYREYSEVFFDRGYRVLRGASWATRPTVARETFRNWALPQRRQIFAGFRCARSLSSPARS